jgi:penicillin-binding protein 1C
VQQRVQFAAEADAGTPGSAAHSVAPLEASRMEWFVQGTQQSQFAINSVAAYPASVRAEGLNGSENSQQADARITAPTSGTIIALDPDIPPKNQRLGFFAQGHNLRWQMDGKVFAKGPTAQWLPWPGKHVVQITDARGRVLDEVRIEVRGAGVRSAQAARRP